MSGSDDPKPPRTLIGQPVPELTPPDESDPPAAQPPPKLPGIAPGLDSTLPMGSTSLRKELQATLAAGPAAAAAKLAAARAADPNPSSTAPMGSAAIKQAAEASPPPAGKGPLAFTAKGTPPSTHELAEAIAKAASEHAERTRSSTQNPQGSPVGVVAQNYGDPNARKQTTPGVPGSDPAIRAGTPVPAAPATGRTPTPGYGSPGARTSSADIPPDSMFARPKSPTGPNPNTPSAFAPSGGYQQPGTNPAVPSGGYAQPGYPQQQGYAQQPNPANAPGYAEQPRKPPTAQRAAVDPTAYDTSRAKPPTGPNPAVDPTAFAPGPASYDPSRGRPPTNPNTGTDPTAYGGPPSYDPSRGRPPTNPSAGTDPTAYGGPPSYDPSRGPSSADPTAYQRGRPATSPNPLAVATAQGYMSPGSDPRNKPPTGPNPAVDPNAFAPKPGSNPAVAAYDPSRPRPPTNPNPAVAHDPTMFTAPGQAGLPAPPVIHTSPNDKTMMAAQAPVIPAQAPVMAAQAPVIPERPRIATEGLRPVAETLREVAVENYEITDEIARGGMGRILRAKDVRLHRQVAIKELLGDNAHFKARFERETLITARLQHPAIVPIYDAGRWPTGELFYTMKLVAGKPLETLIDNVGGISERLRLLPNMIAVAEALAYAHTNNIVHRDLKPANILVGDFGETIVIDWGLAKDLTTNDAAEPAGPFRSPAVGAMGATVAGSVMGTPAYMPLEQGRGLQVDARADVYAIGAVLYHVLSKRAPYDGPDGMSILQALLKEPPPPLSAIAPDVPAELQAIVAKAMAREPEGRYPTCRELVDDLRRYQNGQMVGVHRYTSRELFKRWAKKHKGALAVAALSFVVLVVVGVIAISRVVSANREAQRERDIALEQSKAALEARAAAEVSEARAKKSESQAAEERDRQRFARERRVEFNHFEHSQLRKCAECHPTDPKTFTALAGHPGHAECKGCHDEKSMEGLSNDPKCAFCHIDRVATTKDHTSLRACDDGSVRALKSAGGKVAPCFPHDLKSHRFADDGKPLDCTTCHAVLADKEKWGAKRYVSLQDLDTNTIIGQGPAGGVDAMHKACSIGCHAHVGQTGQGPGETNCSMCHPKRSAVTF